MLLETEVEELRHKYACLINEMFQTEAEVLLPQWLASLTEAGTSIMDMIAVWVAALNEAMNLVEDPEKIWDELVPGYPGEFKWSLVERPQVPPQETLGDVTRKDNIVLDYGCKVYIGDDMFFAHRVEFFLDEHDVQWVKFVPQNGPSKKHETFVRTSTLTMIERNTAGDDLG